MGLLIVVVFFLPRVMAGAHWFTDIAVGSLSVVLVGLSWWLLTPASDKLVNWLNRSLPGKYKPRRNSLARAIIHCFKIACAYLILQ